MYFSLGCGEDKVKGVLLLTIDYLITRCQVLCTEHSDLLPYLIHFLHTPVVFWTFLQYETFLIQNILDAAPSPPT